LQDPSLSTKLDEFIQKQTEKVLADANLQNEND
jgi:hypothetical protein